MNPLPRISRNPTQMANKYGERRPEIADLQMWMYLQRNRIRARLRKVVPRVEEKKRALRDGDRQRARLAADDDE